MPQRRSLVALAATLCLVLVATDAMSQLVVPRVTFQSNVRGATVLVNGQRRGATPLTLRLRAGSYNVRLEASGRAAVTRAIRVTNTGRQTFQIDFGAARGARAANRQVALNANTAATVSINGEQRGVTPVTLPLVAGEYQLQLQASGFLALATTLTVSNQARQSYSFELDPALSTIIVDVPEQFLNKRLGDVGAARGQVQLFVDGERMGQGGLVQVPAGSHLITLLSGGFGFSQQVDLRPGIEYTVRLFLSVEVLETGVSPRTSGSVEAQRNVR